MAVLATLIFTIAYLGYNCSCVSSKLNNATNDSAKVSTPTATQSPADDLKMKDLESRYELTLSALSAESAKLGISSLKDSSDAPGTEVRVLVGFGLAHPRCFILTNSNGTHEASFITAKVRGGRAAMDEEGRILSTRIALHSPASGWDEFEQFLKNQGIEYPLKLSLDDNAALDPDEEVIVVEVKSGSVYRMVFFPANTESEDGKKAWAVWEKIRREFDIKMIST